MEKHSPVVTSLHTTILRPMERLLSVDKPPPPKDKGIEIPPPPSVDEGKVISLGGFKFKPARKKPVKKEKHIAGEATTQIARIPYRAHRTKIREVLAGWRRNALGRDMKANKKIMHQTHKESIQESSIVKINPTSFVFSHLIQESLKHLAETCNTDGIHQDNEGTLKGEVG